MNVRGHALAGVALLCWWTQPLAAQTGFYVEHGDGFSLVRAANGGLSYVEENGKLVRATGHKFALKPVDEYAPFFVSIENLAMRNRSREIIGTGVDTRDFSVEFQAHFKAGYRLENVFLVLDLDSQRTGKSYFLWEVGTLAPHKTKSISVRVPLTENLVDVHYQLHLFANGREVFQSQMPADAIERILDRMIARRIAGVKESAPKPFVGPVPDYEAKLPKGGSVEAVVSFAVATNGRTISPVLVRATDPAYGEAAVAAARSWRFLPAVKDGHAVETKVEMPFVFRPE